MKLDVPVGSKDHALGPANAPITLLEYGDYECPDCGRAHAAVIILQAALGDQLRFVYRHLPQVHLHPHAELAAEAAEAAAAQKRFWEMHDALYGYQRHLSWELLPALARRAGLDLVRFEDDLAAGRFRERVQADADNARRNGAERTPTFFINGVLYEGESDEESLVAAIFAAQGALHQAPFRPAEA